MADHETPPMGEVPGITELGRAFGEPARGETTPPVTMLDAMVLDTIAKFGNDNIPPEPDPYDREPVKPRLSPGSHTVAYGTHKMEFGSDYLTHRFRLPKAVLLCIYHGRFAPAAEVIIDRFAEAGGLASRTVFSSHPENPQEVTKAHQTEFSDHDPLDTLMGIEDFARPLTSEEVAKLGGLLEDPTDSQDAVATLTAVNAGESAMAENNREKRRRDREEHQRSLDSIVEARRAAWREADNIWIG